MDSCLHLGGEQGVGLVKSSGKAGIAPGRIVVSRRNLDGHMFGRTSPVYPKLDKVSMNPTHSDDGVEARPYHNSTGASSMFEWHKILAFAQVGKDLAALGVRSVIEHDDHRFSDELECALVPGNSRFVNVDVAVP